MQPSRKRPSERLRDLSPQGHFFTLQVVMDPEVCPPTPRENFMSLSLIQSLFLHSRGSTGCASCFCKLYNSFLGSSPFGTIPCTHILPLTHIVCLVRDWHMVSKLVLGSACE